MAESATSVGSLTFFGLFAMSAFALFYASPASAPRKLRRPVTSHMPVSAVRARPRAPACPLHPQTSYWLGEANEMVAINTILIIVNGGRPIPPVSGRLGNLFGEKGGELAARS